MKHKVIQTNKLNLFKKLAQLSESVLHHGEKNNSSNPFSYQENPSRQRAKRFQTLVSGSKQPWRSSTFLNKYIILQKRIRLVGSFSLILLLTLTAFTLRPVSVSTDSAEATANPATTTLTVETSGNAAVLDITPSSTSGTFSSSDNSGTSLAFNVSTNNITGYNLSISHGSSTTPAPLTSEDLSEDLDSLPTGTSITESQFNSTEYVGRYGYRPSMLNSADNSNYIPAPTTSSTTLNKTTQANTTSDNYTIALGANIDYTKSAGTYTNTFILTAVANNVAYTINYLDNTGTGGTTGTDVSNLPTTESDSEATASSFTLSSTQPTRTGYTFAGWCDGTVTHNATGNDTCSGTTYSAGGTYSFASPSSTSTNVANLYAMWNVKTYSLAITFAGSGVSSVQVRTASGTSGTLMGTVSTSGGSVSGLTYGAAYYLYPSYSTGYTLNSWSKTDLAVGSVLSSTTATNPTYKIGDGNGAVTITGKSSQPAITFKTSDTSSINFNGTNYANNQTVTIAPGTYQIYGNYGTKYAFKTWGVSGSGSFGNSDYQLTTFTVSGDATITLTGQSVTTAMQNLSATSCTTTPKPVYDTRDNEVYWIQQLADGSCWMLDNLRLGTSAFASGVTYLNHVNTNTSTNISIATSTFTSWNKTSGFKDGFWSAMINTASANIINSDPSVNWGYGSGKYGVYYNYCAASATSKCDYYSTSDAYYDVCPKGWRMPNRYRDLDRAYSSNATKFRNALSTPLSGYFYDSSASSQGSNGLFWSSEYNSNDEREQSMERLSVSLSSVGVSWELRSYGMSVRCILK